MRAVMLCLALSYD